MNFYGLTEVVTLIDGRKLYPIVDRLEYADRDKLGIRINGLLQPEDKATNERVKLGAVRTGEKRLPKAGEWYISGAIPEAYRMPNDGSTISHVIAKLIKFKQIVTYKEVA